MKEEYLLRFARREDMAQALAIYRPYVLRSIASFEFEVPSLEEFTARYNQITAFYPWLLCTEQGGDILGYAYAARFGLRQGYDWVASPSVYLREDARGKGIGKRLYQALFALLRAQGCRGAYAAVACPNPSSEAFHQSMGFVQEGWLKEIGYKFGQNVGIKYYAKALLPPMANPPPPISWKQLPPEALIPTLSGLVTFLPV